MHSGGLLGYMGESKRITFEDLKREFDDIKEDMSTVEALNVPKEAKTPILEEFKKQLDEIKGKMHDYIDAL